MTEPLKFFKIDDSTIYHDGFSYSFQRILDPAKSSTDQIQLQQSFHCQEENCRSRCHVTGNWDTDKKGRKFMLGIVKKEDHTHGQEYRDTIPILRFYQNDDESVHRNGFDYTLNRKLDPPKQIEDFQWHRTYHCTLSNQENCGARIYTTGQWEVNKRDLQYQLGIFKNCFHNHGSDQDSREEGEKNKAENGTVASAPCLTHINDLDKKEQIRFYKYKGTRVQHNGFVYCFHFEIKSHPKWKQRMQCMRQINGKCNCTGYIWTTGKWEEDDRGREFQLGIIMSEHGHEPYQISFQGKDNDDETAKPGLKFYKYMDKSVHRDGHVYCFHFNLKCSSPWRHRMRCTRNNKHHKHKNKHSCNGSIWTTGEWETDELGRVYQRGVLRSGHSHDAFDQFLNEDATAHVGGPTDVKQSFDEDNDVVMIENQ